MSLTERLAKSWLKCAGHLVWMEEERMSKRADWFWEQSCRKRGRPWLRWEDCVLRNINKVGMAR